MSSYLSIKSSPKDQRILAGIGAVIGWLALILQLYLIILNRKLSVSETLVQYFSYFTILTNLLTALCLAAIAGGKNVFFQRSGVQAAIAVYIVIVGIVYNLVLRRLWHPQGLQYLVDELLHTLIPGYYFMYWIFFSPKDGLRYKNTFLWLGYPFLYLIYLLIRGALTGLYPYPFIDETTLGYTITFRNAIILCGFFLVLSLMFVALSKALINLKK